MPDEFIPPKTIKPASITPQQEKTPPKEITDQTFTMDKSLISNSDAATVTIDDKKVDSKSDNKTQDVTTQPVIDKKDEKKEGDAKTVQETEKKLELTSVLKPPVEGKKESDKKVGEGKKEEVKLITPPDKSVKPGAATARDYSGFSEQEVVHLKQMSNEAFEFTSKLIKETKELSKLKDTSFLQHPDAYTLTPDYKQTQTQVYMAGVEANGWREALLACAKGEKFKYPTGFDTKTGELILSGETEPSQAAEEELRSNMMKAITVGQQLQGKLSTMGETFKTRSTTDLQMIEQERGRRFAWVKEPKLLDYTLNFGENGDVSLKQIKADFKALFPPYLQNNPGVEVASDLFIALKIQDVELQSAKAGLTTAEIKTEEAKRGEPTSEIRKGKEPEAINGVKTFSLEGLPK